MIAVESNVADDDRSIGSKFLFDVKGVETAHARLIIGETLSRAAALGTKCGNGEICTFFCSSKGAFWFSLIIQAVEQRIVDAEASMNDGASILFWLPGDADARLW